MATTVERVPGTGKDGAMRANRPDHVILVDGSGYIFRAYHALPPMTRPDGTPINAVYGFTSMLMKLVDDSDAGYLAVIFDTARKTFRSDIYPEYKANRPPPPEDLVPQFPLIREAVRAFGLPCIEKEGFEADDLIATYARRAVAEGKTVTIVSSDKDLMQLVGPGIDMMDPMKGTTIGPDQVRERFGVGPDRVVDVQALAGDSTDNVPGVPGIGVKTAAELINTYGDLESLLARAGEIKQPKRRERLIEHADLARVSMKLVTLDGNAPIDDTVESFILREPDAKTLLDFLEKQAFKSIYARVKAELASAGHLVDRDDEPADKHAPVVGVAYALVQDEDTLRAWADAAMRAGIVAVDTETTSLDSLGCDLVGISLALAEPVKGARACYIPLRHVRPGTQGALDLDGGGAGEAGGDRDGALTQIPVQRALDILRPMLEDRGVLKVLHNAKYDAEVLANCGVNLGPVDDTMLLSYVLDAGLHGHGMDELALLHLGHSCVK